MLQEANKSVVQGMPDKNYNVANADPFVTRLPLYFVGWTRLQIYPATVDSFIIMRSS